MTVVLQAGWPGWYDDMTLGEAMEIRAYGPIACACVGPGWGAPPGAPCPCRVRSAQIDALLRAAHIAARLVLDASQKSPDPDS